MPSLRKVNLALEYLPRREKMLAGAFLFVLCLGFFSLSAQSSKRGVVRPETYCNPMDIEYRFRPDSPSRREAADPTMLNFDGQYWLFPSKSGGYWQSADLLHWRFIATSSYPVESYAPTVISYQGKVYLTAGFLSKLYVATDLAQGKWEVAADFGRDYGDPALFVDDDGKVYIYWGVSDKEPLHITEVDPDHGWKAARTVDVPESRDPEHRGWEIAGDTNDLLGNKPWIEGAWMNKHAGTYYLQYAAPGTQYRTYADGVLSSSSPMGPFVAAALNPFSFKPTGFTTGAGHGSTFADANGQFWHVATTTISVRHMFERRLSLYPATFDPDGSLMADTYLADYPHSIGGDRGLVGWMLLSRRKPVTASTSMDDHPARLAVNEDIQTWWSATSGDPGQWLEIDLGKLVSIQAMQINFGDEGSTILGRSADVYRYLVETSNDHKTWQKVVDHSMQGRDSSHDYEVLPQPVNARFVRITNVHSPNGAKFSLQDLRVFGSAGGSAPALVSGVQATLDGTDRRHATITWVPAKGAEFYVVRIGPKPGEQNLNYQQILGLPQASTGCFQRASLTKRTLGRRGRRDASRQSHL